MSRPSAREADRVLVVDDEADIVALVAYHLAKAGYRVSTAASGAEAVDVARRDNPSLVVLDLMLPGISGYDVLQQLREDQRTQGIGVLLLTARREEPDRIRGLSLGADDYLTKPFSMRELMARVKAQLRRTRLLQEELDKSGADRNKQTKLTFGDLVVNLTRREVTLYGEPIQLKPQEYELLAFFAEHKGQMLSREFVLERVWGWDFIGDSRTVDVHVRWLRQKIEDDPGNPVRIITVRGGGYRFEG